MPIKNTSKLLLNTALLFNCLTLTQQAFSDNFTVRNGQVETAQQTLTDNETGIIEAGGELNTTGQAITASGINNTVENSGNISTTGDFGYGIESSDNNANISNNGSISTSGIGAHSVSSSGNNSTINNSGNISTAGSAGQGIRSFGNNNTINSSGRISTLGGGIYSNGGNNTISNNGSIVTSGDSSEGILTFGDDNIVTNSGSIVTSGNSSEGIWAFGDGNIVTNSGSIVTSGGNSEGLWAFGYTTATFSNSGNIVTLGDYSDGVHLQLIDAIFDNSGSIITLGEHSNGISSYAPNSTINNSGLISATGTDAFAILGSSNNITLNLFPGSQIIGPIDLGNDGGDLDTVNIYAGNPSASLTFENTEVINLFGTGVIIGNRVIAVDSTGESTRGVALAKTTSAIHNVINQRMAHTIPLAPSRTASTTHTPGALFQERKPVAWVQFFGGETERDSEGEALEYEHDYQGFTLGYERDYGGHRLGFMGGGVQSETETDTSSFKTETDSYYLGAYGHINLGSVSLTTALIGGYSDSDNKRVVWDNLNGKEVAKSDLDGLFISPSITLSSAYQVNNHLELRPSASVNYSVAWLDSYREHGTTSSNLKVDDRTSRALSARLQLAAAYKFSPRSEIELRTGMNSRHTDDDDIDANLAGSNFRYGVSGDEDVTGGYAGLNVRFAASENLSLIADIEFGRASGDEDSTSGHLTLEYRF